MKKLKVLSIDWDYFIDCSAYDRADLFPDGGNENLPAEISNMIWGSRYLNENLKKIGYLEDDAKYICCVLDSQIDKHCEMVVVDSHKYLYNKIVEFMKSGDYENLDITNIDFHHDLYEFNDNVDCGNWFRYIIDKYGNKGNSYRWIKRNDSDDVPKKYKGIVKESIGMKEDLDNDYDIIFICRSGMWSPPHLDKQFSKTFEFRFIPFIEKGIFDDRMEQVKLYYEQYVKEKSRILEMIGEE